MSLWNSLRTRFTPPFWGTVTTALEPTPLLISFVAHYLNIGAQEVRLYLERSDPELDRLVANDRRVKIITTDNAYWKRAHKGVRPEVIIGRQRRNLAHALKHSRCKWLFHIDSDEFLVDHGPVIDTLRNLSPNMKVLSIPNAERVFLRGQAPQNVYDGVFRLPFVREQDNMTHDEAAQFADIYGDSQAYVHRGMAAYSGYKSFFRVGAGLKPDVHQPAPRREWKNHKDRMFYKEAVLLHYDSFTMEHWTSKMHRLVYRYHAKLADPSRPGLQPSRTHTIRKMLSILDLDGPDGLVNLFNDILTLDAVQADKLETLGKLRRTRFDPQDAIAKVWPDLAVKLDEDSINDALRDMQAKIQADKDAQAQEPQTQKAG